MFDEQNNERKEHTGGGSFIYGTVAELRSLLPGAWKDVESSIPEDELGAHLARVRIIRNPDGSESFEFELLGSPGGDQSPHLDINTDTIDFGPVVAHHVKDVAIVLSNNGSKSIEIHKISKIGAETQAFSFSGIGTPFLVLPGHMVQVYLHFMPRTEGTYAAALHIETAAGDESNLVVTLAGTGLPSTGPFDEEGDETPFIVLEPNPAHVGQEISYRYIADEPVQCGIVVYDAFAQELYARYRVEIAPGVHPLPAPLDLDGGKYFVKFLFPHTQRILSLIIEGKKKRPRGRPPKKRW